MVVEQTRHEMLVHPSHDEEALQSYVSDLRFYLLNEVGAGMRKVYENRLKGEFEQQHGRPPQDKREVHELMMSDHYTKSWSTMMRSCQEMMWDSVLPSVHRDDATLRRKLEALPAGKATLTLDDRVEVPRYVNAIDIHCMPGGYHSQADELDVTQGALYDRGVYVYQMGFAGGLADGIGRSVAEFIRQKFPDFRPKRILDVGCTVGHNTGPFCEVFPDAEVHAIDCCPGLLRYGHARARFLGLPVHFKQMDARQLAYDDESFDIVFSCILFHETSHSAHRDILRECRRALRPGGININMELPPNEQLDPYDGFHIDWDAYYNNEPYYAANTSTDAHAVMESAGFDQERIFEWLIPDFYMAERADFDAAVNADHHSYRETGRWGEIVRWYGYGARK